jgi:hypothetical protein
MIKLEITDSAETLSIGTYNYLYDQVFIGRSKKCDLIFLEKGIPLKFLTITANDKSLVIQSEQGTPPYYINGKKTSGAFKLKNNDVVSINSHSIKILDFKQTHESIDLTPFYEKLADAPPEIKEALSLIEEKLVALEEEH